MSTTSSTKTNLLETVASQGSFAIFGKALNAAGLADKLKGRGSIYSVRSD
jgi:hypothetical protein